MEEYISKFDYVAFVEIWKLEMSNTKWSKIITQELWVEIKFGLD